jgi:hypothetical protein
MLDSLPALIGSAFGLKLCGPLGTDTAPRLLGFVDPLFQPSLNGLSTVPHVSTHPVADWAVAHVPPAVQSVNRDTQHFRDIG